MGLVRQMQVVDKYMVEPCRGLTGRDGEAEQTVRIGRRFENFTAELAENPTSQELVILTDR